MGNSCNLSTNQHFSGNTLYTDIKNETSCMGCISNQPGNTYVDGPELHATHYSIPKGRISTYSVSYLTADEISFFKLCSGKNLAAIRHFLKKGVNVNSLDEDRSSPLHIACRSGSAQVIEELINWGANINIADMAGWTPLHVAAFYQKSFTCHILLKKGADPYCVNRNGETPWDLVKEKEETEKIFLAHFDRLQLHKMTKRKLNGFNVENVKGKNDDETEKIIMNMNSSSKYDANFRMDIPILLNSAYGNKSLPFDSGYKMSGNHNLIPNNESGYNGNNNEFHKASPYDKSNAGPIISNMELSGNVNNRIDLGKNRIMVKSQSSNYQGNDNDARKGVDINDVIHSNYDDMEKIENKHRCYSLNSPSKKYDAGKMKIKAKTKKSDIQHFISPKRHKYYLYYKKLRQEKKLNSDQEQDMLCTLNSEDEEERYNDFENLESKCVSEYGTIQDILLGQETGKNHKSRTKIDENAEENCTDFQENLEAYATTNQLLKNDIMYLKPPTNSNNIIKGNSAKQPITTIQNSLISNKPTTANRLYNAFLNPKFPSNLSLVNQMQSNKDKMNELSPKSSKSMFFVDQKSISIYQLIKKEGVDNSPNDLEVLNIPSGMDGTLIRQDSNVYPLQFKMDKKFSDDIFQMGIDLFNFDCLKGIGFLILFKMIRAHPKDLAHFLYKDENLKNLKKNQYEISQFLANINIKEINDILAHYADCFEFNNMSYITSLRSYLANLILDNDPEKFDILLNAFAKKYFSSVVSANVNLNMNKISKQQKRPEEAVVLTVVNKGDSNNKKEGSKAEAQTEEKSDKKENKSGFRSSNKEKFDTVEAVHMLSFATVMLDINLNHSKTKVEDFDVIKKDFQLNLFGINDGENLSKTFVNSVFDSVQKFKLFRLCDYEILAAKSSKKLSFKNLKLSIIANKTSKKNKNIVNDYTLNIAGPVCFIVKMIGLKSIPKHIINLIDVKLKLNNQILAITPLNNNNNKGNNGVFVAKFNNDSTIKIISKNEICYNLYNPIDFGKLESYIKSLK